jgi:uncharacterized protein YjbI with pentapeptide repeats
MDVDVVPQGTYQEADFAAEDLSGVRADGCRFVRCDFSGADLGRGSFLGAVFEDCTLEQART